MKMNGEEAYHFSRGLRAMLDAFIHLHHSGIAFGEAVKRVADWHDAVLLPWKDQTEDAEQTDTFDDQELKLHLIGE